MNLIQDLSLLAVRQTLGDRADSLLNFVGDRAGDHARRLENALHAASDRAWRCLEVALVGTTLWGACRSLLQPRDAAALQEQVRSFLDSLPPTAWPDGAHRDAFRRDCLVELRSARRVGMVPGTSLSVNSLVEQARGWARFADRRALLDADRQRVEAMGTLLEREGYPNLARYVGLRPSQGEPLLVQSVRYFFRRQVEADPRLATGLTLESLEGIGTAQRDGFRAVEEALGGLGQRVEELLSAVSDELALTRRGVERNLEVSGRTHDEVVQLRSEMAKQSQELRHLAGLMARLLEGKSTPPAAASPQPTADWEQVGRLLARCESLSDQERQQRPELARVAGQFTEAAGQYEAARRRAGGPPISAIFLAQPSTPSAPSAPANEAPLQERPRRRLLSPLFDPKPADGG